MPRRAAGAAAGVGREVQLGDRDAPIFVISVAAKLSGMHPQTLRSYDRLGLVQPKRTSGRGRRYSPRDVARLRLIQTLSKEEGVNLEGIRRILSMEEELESLRGQVSELTEMLHQAQRLAHGPRIFAADGSGSVRMTHAQRRSTPRGSAPRGGGR